MQSRLLARVRAVHIRLMAPLLGLALFVSVFVAVSAPAAQAATSSNLNFQARLLTSSGAIVPDGNYNIDFKLYTADSTTGSVGTCTGACVWEETRKNSNSQGVTVINGYFSVNLGSVTAFGGSINWDQQLWLTMNIGGTSVGASPTWDGEMQNAGHSIALTALPYSFVAGQLASSSGANRGTLSFGSVTNNPAIQLPNESGTVCTTAASGVCNTAGSLSNVAYLNQTQTFTGTNTFQPSTNVSSLIVKQTTVASPTADIFDVQTVNATKVIQVSTNATDNASLRLSSVGTGSTVLLQGDDEKISFSGTESRILIDTTGSGISNFIDFFRNTNTTSSRRLRVFKGDSTSTETFGIDASNGNILMGNNLDLETAGSLTIGGSTATTVTLGSTTASSGSQTFNIGNNATAGTYASTVNVGSTLNASATNIKGGSGGINLSPSGASNSGVLVKPGTDSTAAFQVQPASSSTPVIDVDTSNSRIGIGTNSPSANLHISSTATNDLFRIDDNGSGDTSPFIIDQNGNVIIGLTSPQSGAKFTSYLSSNAISGSVYNNYSLLQPVVTSASTANYYSMYGRAEYHSSSTAGINAGGSLNALGLDFLNSSTTTLDIAKGITVSLPTNAGTITNTYGVYVGDITVGTQTNTPYSFYASDGNARNYFAGTTTFQTSVTDSATAFQIQDQAGTANLFIADTSSKAIGLGTASPGARLEIKGKSATSSDYALIVGSSSSQILTIRDDGQIISNQNINFAGGFGPRSTSSGAAIVLQTGGASSGNITIDTSTSNGATKNIELKSGGSTVVQNSSGVAVLTIANAGGTTFKNSTDSSSALVVQKAASSNLVMAVDTSGNQLVLGTAGASGLNGKLVFSTTNASNTTISIAAASTATSYSLTLPTSGPSLGQCLQNDGTTVGQLTFGACGASGTFLSKNSTDTSSAAGGSGYLYGFTSSGSSTGGVLSLNNSTNTGNALNVTTAGNPASGKAVIYGENTNASPTGNLIDLRSGSSPTSKFSVDASGNVIFGGTLNTNTFTSTSLAFAGAGSASLQSASSQALNITGNATSLWQVGGTNQNLTIQTSGTGILALDTVGLGTVNLGAVNAGTINIGNNNSTVITIGGTSVLGTVTNKVTGLTTTLTGAASNSSYVVKSTSNSNGTFQVQNSGGNKVFSVDTTAGQTVLGQSNSLNGSLLFQNSSNTNGITLNTAGGSGNYTLTLPTAAPAGGLCIETSPGNASQLVFASCSNNNASIQQVAYWDANNQSTVSVSPTTAGDELVLTTQIPTGGVTVTGIAGGGVASGGWTKVIANSGNGTVNRVEMWVGTVTTTGSSTITVTYSSSPGSNEITTTEFTAAGVNASTSWGIESSAAQLNSTASTTVTYPNMTAVSGSELYVGYAQVQNPPASNGAGCNTANFSYQLTSTQHNMITYNTSLTANTAYQPIACQSSSGQSNTVAGVLTAFVTSSSINNTTSLQKANFYVQAATSGTVAGVLQAASSGSADIFNLRNSGGTNVLTVGSTGNVLVKPSASATAFQVQNGSGYSVMAVDTSGNSVVLGDATHLSGSITFKDSSDSNTISIAAPSSVAATYTLSLPTNTPTAGLCLGTSPSNANQLIFASCATQVSAASITYINQWSNSGTNTTTLPVSPASVGNLMVLFTHTANNVSIPGGGVSGGGVTNWTKVTSNVGGGTIGNDEMWRGVVTATGSSTITISSYSGAGADEITAQEYTMGGTGGGTWAIDTSGTLTGTSTTINYPSLTPANSSELYAGYAWSANAPTPSGTSGYTYTATNSGKYTARNTSVTGGVATQPQSTQASGNFNSIAAVIQAFAGTSVIVNSTATQQANFNVQAPISGTVAGVLQGAASGSADILQIKDGSGNNVMSVNGSSGVTLGTSTVASGTIVFNASGNSNTITILAPSTPGTSYQLKLPSAQAAPGQCLAASPSDNTQLVFSSCANQVTSVAISFVNSWKTNGNGVTSLSTSPANLNDLMILISSPRGAGTISGTPTGGGVTTWSKISSTTAGSGSDTSTIEMWKGVVTSTGSSPISVSYSGSVGNPNELAAMEFTTSSSTGSWVVDASNTQYNGTSSTTITFPNLTPQSSRDLYVGYAAGANGNTSSSGGSTGFTYLTGSIANRIGLYNPNISAATQPVATQNSAGASLTVGALVAAYSSSSVISNSTVTQQANFNIQAATSGSVAGVLQAFAGGTGDILNLLDGSGTLTDKFDYQGNLLVRPSTAGATAFQVQTTGSVNVLSVDTSAKQVVVGAGSTGESTPSLLVLDNQTGSSADPSGVNGAMYYNATNHTFRCYESGAWQNCGGLLSSNTSQSSANSNCSNNCAAFSTFASIPANYCQAGRVIKLNAHGYFSSQASATNLQFGVYYGTDGSVAANDTLIGTLTPTVSVASASNNYFGLDFDVTCFSTTSMQADGLANIQVGAAASGVTGVPISSTSPTTIVSTSAKNIYIFPIWGATSASDTAKITQFIVTSP